MIMVEVIYARETIGLGIAYSAGVLGSRYYHDNNS